MTKENFTSINVIIDKSGSMHHLKNDTIGGFNQFLSDQKLVPGEVVFTLCTFSTDHKFVHNFVKMENVPNLDDTSYVPNGNTALLDAVGKTIDQVGNKLSALPEEERPSKVLFLIITDGQENASREFTKEKVRSMITHQREVYNWEFVFMGANIDSFAEGASLGISKNHTFNFMPSAAGTKDLYRNISSSTTRYRSSGNYSAPTPTIVPPTNNDSNK